MVDERVLRARAEAEAEELRDELGRMAEERLRIARRNERLTSTLLELRAAAETSEGMQQQIDDALDYDGGTCRDLNRFDEDAPSSSEAFRGSSARERATSGCRRSLLLHR